MTQTGDPIRGGFEAEAKVTLQIGLSQRMAMQGNVPLKRERDMVLARQAARALALKLGFSKTEAILIASVVSDLTRQILDQGSTGEIVLKQVKQQQNIGIQLAVKASRPASLSIFRRPDSSSGSSGPKLRGFARCMDEIIVTYPSGEDATVTAIRWKR